MMSELVLSNLLSKPVCTGCLLLITDTESDINIFKDLQQKYHYTLQIAQEGNLALDQAAEHHPDIILLASDFSHPPANLLIRHFQSKASLQKIPIISIVEEDEELDRKKLFKNGYVDYLIRPLQAEEIYARVNMRIKLQTCIPEGQDSNYALIDIRKLESVFTSLLSNSIQLEEKVAEHNDELIELNKVYERFVPREFLDFLNKNSITEVKPGDQVQREMTVLFMDIRDFTSLSEKMNPQQNFNFLNAFLNQISPVIREYNGFIDKYIGDAVMALFPSNPEDALKAAIKMCKVTERHNVKLRALGYPLIRIGIGVHTGRLMLGILGDKERMQSTVISDSVNLASRLEGLSKIYGTSIILSKHTLSRISNLKLYNFRFVGKIQVKGKNNAISVYEILDGEKIENIQLKLKTKQDFEKGLSFYQSKKFAEASVQFSRILEINANDKAARLYFERCAQLMVHGVPDDWDGIEVMQGK
jgi:class 3 adenylate cyclase/CheY-like chemotaxis protein